MYLSHLSMFSILFFLSIVRPEAFFSNLPLPVGPIAVIVAATIFLVTIHRKPEHIKTLWKRYKEPLFLVLAYITLCVVSLLYNYDRYEGVAEFLRWGLVFIVGQAFLLLCVLLFLLEPTEPFITYDASAITKLFSGLLLLSIPVSVLTQVYYPDSAKPIMQFVVGGDLPTTHYPVRGVLATSTDLGAICAIVVWSLTALAVKSRSTVGISASIITVYVIAFAVSGVLSGSRNFILFMMTAMTTLMIAIFWERSKILAVLTLPGVIATSYASAYILPDKMLEKMGNMSPYFRKVRLGDEVEWSDLLPHVTSTSLGPRYQMWEAAIKHITENPLLGISNGGFRTSDECLCNAGNTHNILLQSAIDAGVLGTFLMCLMLAYVIRQSAADKWSLSLLLGVVATLLVDNFTDHSYAWIVLASYACISTHRAEDLRRA